MATSRSNSSGSKKKSSSTWRSVRMPHHGAVLSIDEVAQAAGTVGYELMCALAQRVPVSVD